MTTGHHRDEKKALTFNLDELTMKRIRSASSGNRSYALRKIVAQWEERGVKISVLEERVEVLQKALNTMYQHREEKK